MTVEESWGPKGPEICREKQMGLEPRVAVRTAQHSGVIGTGEGRGNWGGANQITQAVGSLRPRSQTWPARPMELGLIGCYQHWMCVCVHLLLCVYLGVFKFKRFVCKMSTFMCVCVCVVSLAFSVLPSLGPHMPPSISSSHQADHGGMLTIWSIHHMYQNSSNHVIISPPSCSDE